jgi:DNA recombination protein RmuC
MDIVILLIVMAAAALLGLAAGWLGWGRGAASLRTERDELREKFGRAITELAAAEERARRADALQAQLDETRADREAARIELQGVRAEAQAREAAFEQRLTELREAREALSAQFSEIGQKLLGDAQRQFLERADQRFHQAGEKSEAQLKALLQPVETTLKRYEEGLQRVEKERVGSYGELKAAVAQLTQGNEQVRRETQRLANVMRSSPKARGRWGEEQLRTILESAGLAENVDFTLQGSVSDGEKQLRPDCVINLPGDRCIVVDVKCPLVHFEAAFDEEDEERRLALLLQHAAAMKSYANDLGRNLNLATGAYNDFVGSLETKVMTQARRFEELKIDTGGKTAELLPVVDTTVRPLTKLSAEDAEAAAAE